MGFGQERIDFFEQLIQLLGKPIYTNKWKIRKNMASNLPLPTSGNQLCVGKLNRLPDLRYQFHTHGVANQCFYASQVFG